MRALARVALEFWIVLATSFAFLGSVILASQVSLDAVVAGIVGVSLISLPVRMFVVRRITGIDRFPELQRGAPILFAAIAMGGAVVLWRLLALQYLSGPYLLVSSIVVGFVSYSGLIAFLDRETIQESLDIFRSTMVSKQLGGKAAGDLRMKLDGPVEVDNV